MLGKRIVGRVDAPQAPILELDSADIAAYGAGSLEELLEVLASQTGSARGRGSGRRAFLVNGVRISSFRELASYPPEAISRVEVLPEEVALRYGFAADQRVINFVLKERFASREIEIEYGVPGDGGYAARELEATLLKIADGGRYNLNAEVTDSSLLTEAERGVVLAPADTPDVAGDSDPTALRSLVDDSSEYALTANYTRALGDSGGALSVNGSAGRTDSLALAGPDTVRLTAPDGSSALRSLGDEPLARRSRVDTLAAGATLNAYAGRWQLTGTLDARHERRDQAIDRTADSSDLVAAAAAGTLAIDGFLPPLADAGFDEVRRTEDGANLLFTAVTQPLSLPAGDLSLTLDAGFDLTRIDSRDSRNPGLDSELERRDFAAGFDLGIPLANGARGGPAAVGTVTLNLNGGLRHLSDFGTLADWTVGLSWAVTESLELQLTQLAREAAPLLSQLGDPEVVNLNTPTFDFLTGDTVLASVITGGNPNLAAENQHDLRLAARWDLPVLDRSSLLVEYNGNHAENVSAPFPLLTPGIETAFPQRIRRDGNGRLSAVDQRPITLVEQESSRLRFGLELAGKFGDGGNRSGGRSSVGSGRRGDDGVGRWRLSVAHTIELSNEVLLAEGVPRLDLLDGDALADGGVSRHSLSIASRVYHRGYGLRISSTYQSESTVNGTGLPGSSDLNFGSLATLNLRFFADLGRRDRLLELSPLFEGTRLSLRVDNVFDERRRVIDGSGDVPLRYQPFLIDPVGRFVELELRKLFSDAC